MEGQGEKQNRKIKCGGKWERRVIKGIWEEIAHTKGILKSQTEASSS